MQPMPTSQHPGPAGPDDSGPAAPVHGTAVPTPRHVVGASPITEATTEMPLIVPNSADRRGPSPLPPIATQLLGGVTHLPAPEPPADRPARAGADEARAGADAAASDADAEVALRDPDAPESDAAQHQETGLSANAEPGTTATDEHPDSTDAVVDTDPTVEDDVEPRAATAPGAVGDPATTDDEVTNDNDDEQDEERAAVLTTVDEQVEPAVGSDTEPAADALAADEPVADTQESHGQESHGQADTEPAAETESAVDESAVDESAVDESAAAGSDSAPAKRPGDVSMPPITIWSEAAADDLRDEWHEIKARFVDEPDVAVMQAQSLVAHTVRTLAERLLAEQLELDPHRHSELPDTESMRMALRHYREFLDRLLAI
ncbi:hypothetical protein [Micromonospora sp. LOL_023]|uniref:hypothetical protein n=1 Tax=Micromonospora sp. LOL_023 TaxID=3345418 RepID=UPI003A86262E